MATTTITTASHKTMQEDVRDLHKKKTERVSQSRCSACDGAVLVTSLLPALAWVSANSGCELEVDSRGTSATAASIWAALAGAGETKQTRTLQSGMTSQAEYMRWQENVGPSPSISF